MKNYLTAAVMLLLFASCKKEFTSNSSNPLSASVSANADAALTAVKADYWDSVFTRYGGGWTGGDGAISYKLPDGRVMWLWGDSFLDTVYPDRHRPVIGFIHNQVTTMNLQGGNFTTYYGGTKQNPVAYISPSKGSQYYWPTYAFMNSTNSEVYVFLDKVKATGTGGFDFKITSVDMAVLDYPSLAIKEIKPFLKVSKINWAGDAYESSDGYVYIFGTESTTYNKFIHVARTTKANPAGDIRYWNGTTWTTDLATSQRIMGGVSEGFSYFTYQGKNYLVSQENLLGPNIYLWDAASPTGPYTNKRLVYTTFSKVGTQPVWTYNAKAHSALINNGQLLIGFCSNAQNAQGLYKNADTYRPYFVWVSNWQ